MPTELHIWGLLTHMHRANYFICVYANLSCFLRICGLTCVDAFNFTGISRLHQEARDICRNVLPLVRIFIVIRSASHLFIFSTSLKTSALQHSSLASFIHIHMYIYARICSLIVVLLLSRGVLMEAGYGGAELCLLKVTIELLFNKIPIHRIFWSLLFP